MKLWYPLSLVATFAAAVYAADLDLGDITQYAPKLTALPDGIQADSIWVGPADGGGFHIVLGQDIRAKVDGVLQACGEPNDKCYHDVLNALEDGVVRTDHNLERRQLVAALAVVAEFFTLDTLVAAVGIIHTVQFAVLKQMGFPFGMFFPEAQAKPAGNLPQGAVTVSAGGTAVVTITQAPSAEPTLEGSVTPIVTAVTTAVDGFQTGDLAGVLDKDLAGRLGEYMQRSKACKAGDDFDKQHPSPARKRAGGTYGQALCASEAVIGGIQAGGIWNDFLLLDPKGVQFKFSEASGTASAAASQFSEFAGAYRPLMGVTPERADQLSSYIFALAVDAVVQELPLGEKNRIQATMVTTSASSPTGTGCPDKKSIVCGIPTNQDCNIKIAGEGDKKTVVCEDGKWKDCPCTGPALLSIEMTPPERQKTLMLFTQLFKNVAPPAPPATPETLPTCPNVVTAIPAEVFSSRKTANMNIHNHFCQGWRKEAKQSMTVDSKGANLLPEPQLKAVSSSRIKRTPPPNAGSYSEFRFDLSFTPSDRGGACSMDCNAAYAQFASTCAASSPGIYMYEKGSYDVGCGTFTYQIVQPASLEAYPPICYKRAQLPPVNGTLQEGIVKSWAQSLPCLDARKTLIKKGDQSTFVQKMIGDYTTKTLVWIQYNVWWREGCVLEKNGPSESTYLLPIGEGEGKPWCSSIFGGLANQCAAEDEKVGGSVQIGCLVYEVVDSDVKRTTWGSGRER